MLFEHGFYLKILKTGFILENPQDGQRFVCMMLRGKTLRPGMSILSVLLLTLTLLVEGV